MAISIRAASPEVMAIPDAELVPPPEETQPRRRGRPKGSKNRPKTETLAQAKPKAETPPPAEKIPATDDWRETFFLSAALVDRFGEFVLRQAVSELGGYEWPPSWSTEFRAVELRTVCEYIKEQFS